MATVNADLAALEASETVALTRAKGAVEARDVKFHVVLDHLLHLRGTVQRAADADPNNAEAIVTSATMSVWKTPTHIKQEFVANQGTVSGTVKLVAKSAAPRASYEWQWSLDQKSWTNVQTTLQAKVVVTGLTPGLTHYFRHRAVTKAGTSDWSQVASIIVK